MTRANARELAVHLIYGREFTGEEPEQTIQIRLAKEYYSVLSQDNDIYSERPSKAQLGYIDAVVSGVANRVDMLNEENDESALMKRAVITVINNMEDPCKTILWSYYWQGMNMKEIAQVMHYKSDTVAKSKKSHCMTKVRVALQEAYNQLRS